jgi:hypothetical protein
MTGRRSTLRRVFELVMFGNGILALIWVRYSDGKIHSRGEIVFWWVLLVWFALSFFVALRDLFGRIQKKENPSS